MTHSKFAFAHSLNPTTLLASISASEVAAVAIFLVTFLLVIVVIAAFIIISRWKIFEKAGVSGWKSLIPIYNLVKELEIVGAPLWWIVLLFVPFVNIVVFIIVARRLAGVFGKGVGFTWGLVLLPFIFYPMLAFGSSTYANTYPPARPMSEVVKWSIVGLFLFILVESFSMLFSINIKTSAQYTPEKLTALQSGFGYAVDGNYVYYEDHVVGGADPATFKVDGDYGMDKTSVYFAGKVMDGVDSSVFKVLLGGVYAVTDKNVYYDDQLIQGADPLTFELLGTDSTYSEDLNTVYADGTPVVGVDRATFTLVNDSNGNYNAKDKNNYYWYGEHVTKSGKYLPPTY